VSEKPFFVREPSEWSPNQIERRYLRAYTGRDKSTSAFFRRIYPPARNEPDRSGGGFRRTRWDFFPGKGT
jgi:hypothetical protein